MTFVLVLTEFRNSTNFICPHVVVVLKMTHKAFNTYERTARKSREPSPCIFFRLRKSVKIGVNLRQTELRQRKHNTAISAAFNEPWYFMTSNSRPICHGRLWDKQAKRRLMANYVYTSRPHTAVPHIITAKTQYLISRDTKNSL